MMYKHRSGAVTYLTTRALSVNEGGRWANIHLSWAGRAKGFYVYLFGYRMYRFW